MSNLNNNNRLEGAGAEEEEEAIPFRLDPIFQAPIARLNTDIWDIIFDKYVTHPTDQRNLILASPQFFGELLREEKCALLFGEVLDILFKKQYLALSISEYLGFRGLSKACKLSIDQKLETNCVCFLRGEGINHAAVNNN